MHELRNGFLLICRLKCLHELPRRILFRIRSLLELRPLCRGFVLNCYWCSSLDGVLCL